MHFYMNSRVLFFILLYELSIDPGEQTAIFKQFITGFFLKPEHHFHRLLRFCFVPTQKGQRRTEAAV